MTRADLTVALDQQKMVAGVTVTVRTNLAVTDENGMPTCWLNAIKYHVVTQLLKAMKANQMVTPNCQPTPTPITLQVAKKAESSSQAPAANAT